MSDTSASPPAPRGAPPAESVAGVPTPSPRVADSRAAATPVRWSRFAGLSWWAIALRGIAAILFGLVALVFPIAALGSLILLLSAYLAADGVLAIVSATQAARAGEGWVWLGIEGVLNIGAALIALFLPGLTAVSLVILLAAWAIASGGAMLVAAWRGRAGRLWFGLGGVVSVGWGIAIGLQPAFGAVVLAVWLGLYALAFGFVLLVMGLRLRQAPGAVAG